MLPKSHLRFVSALGHPCIRGKGDTQLFQLLQEQNKYDQIPLDLLDRLRRILIFADKVADEIVYDETEILERTIPRMFKVMQNVAKCSCDYVKRGRFGRQLAFLNLANADDRREDVEWAGPPTEGRGNGPRVDQGH